MQQKYSWVGFPYAVVKKYGENNGGYLAALLTYYGFLSLFPLLLVLITFLDLFFNGRSDIYADVLRGINTYFPLLGDELQSNISGSSKNGWALALGIVLSIYGARGAADTLRFVLDTVWLTPKHRRSGLPKGILKSLAVMIIIALGFLATVGASVVTSGLGHAGWVKVVANAMGFAIVSGALVGAFHVGASRRLPIRKLWVGAIFGGLILQLLLTFGSILLKSQLKNFDSLYGAFAIVLGLLFWIYLLAQVLVYAAEIDSVRILRLWPRAINKKKPTAADHRAYAGYAETEKYIPPEEIDVSFTGEQSPRSTPKAVKQKHS